MGCNVSSGGCNAVDAAMLLLKNGGGGGVTPEELEAALAVKADKVAGAVAGNLAALDGTGNLTDSGLSKQYTVGSLEGLRTRVDALYKLTQGQLWDTELGDSPAYIQDVPAGGVLAEVNKISGRTVMWNQLVKNGNFATATEWASSFNTISIANNELTFVATNPVDNSNIIGNVMPLVPGSKYYVAVEVIYDTRLPHSNPAIGDGGYQMASAEITEIGTWVKIHGIITASSSGDHTIRFYPRTAGWQSTDSGRIRNVVTVGLTEMFGAGNEPTTTDEPRIAAIEAYAALHPEYNARSLLSAEVTSVKSVGKNIFGGLTLARKLNEVSASSILNESEKTVSFTHGSNVLYKGFKPDTLYGIWLSVKSVNTKNNSLVVRYTDGTQNQISITENGLLKYNTASGKSVSNVSLYYYSDGNTVLNYENCGIMEGSVNVVPFSPYIEANMLIPESVRALEGYGESEVGGNGNTLNLVDGTYTEIGHYVVGVWTALAEPAVTDVAAYLADNSLEVEVGGTVTFEQSNDLKIEVPNEVEYLVKLEEVVGA